MEFKHGWNARNLAGDFTKIYGETCSTKAGDDGSLAGSVIMTVIEEVETKGKRKSFDKFEAELPEVARLTGSLFVSH